MTSDSQEHIINLDGGGRLHVSWDADDQDLNIWTERALIIAMATTHQLLITTEAEDK